MQVSKAVLDSGASSSFIRLGELHHLLREKMELLGDNVTILNASDKQVSIIGIIVTTVQIGNGVLKRIDPLSPINSLQPSSLIAIIANYTSTL